MVQILTRSLKIKLPKGQSAFLWGPRKTGKTTFLTTTLPESLRYDLLQTDIFLEFIKRPFLLRDQLLAKSVKQIISQTFGEGCFEESGLACFPRSPQKGGLPFRQFNFQRPVQHLIHGCPSSLVQLTWSVVLIGQIVKIFTLATFCNNDQS